MLPFTVRILPLLACLATAPALAQTPSPAPSPGAKPAATAPASPGEAKSETKADPKAPLIDINSASAEELSALKGIGAARSAAIVKGRPYRGKDDLLHRKIVPEGVYVEIKDRIVARQK